MAKLAGQSLDRSRSLKGKSWALATALVFILALCALVPTTGDFGLTWDEPSYRHSQVYSEQWWNQLAHVNSAKDLGPLLDPQSLLYYWPYGRYGINFHPPLAGQLNLLTYELFGGFMKDIPARRMASVLEFAATITLLFSFVSRRYGFWPAAIASLALLTIPRLYADAHLAATDTPGLFLWTATALAFWKGLEEPKAWLSRTMVGVLVGLAFVEKMSAMGVLVPLLLWLAVVRLPRAFTKPQKQLWIQAGLLTSLMALPLVVAFLEILRIKRLLPPPAYTDLSKLKIESDVPGAILLTPLAVWILYRLSRLRFGGKNGETAPTSPALEIWYALFAFPPVIAWLGNPAWWRETMPRLAHYYTINSARQVRCRTSKSSTSGKSTSTPCRLKTRSS